MAHLWILDSDDWKPTNLDGDAFVFLGGALQRAPCFVAHAEACALLASAPPPRVVLRRLAESTEAWALLTDGHSQVRVNGMSVRLGLAVLADRDEIRASGVSAWFSTETTARIEPFPESETRGFCPRCKQAITSGIPAVRCPGCGLWHHESDELPCWTYASTCTACAHDTALDAGFSWTPGDL